MREIVKFTEGASIRFLLVKLAEDLALTGLKSINEEKLHRDKRK